MLRLRSDAAESTSQAAEAALETLTQKYIRRLTPDDEGRIRQIRRSVTLQPDEIAALCAPGSDDCQSVLERWSHTGGLLLPDGEQHIPELVRGDIGYVLRYCDIPPDGESDIAGYASVYTNPEQVQQHLAELLLNSNGHAVNPEQIEWIAAHQDQIAVSREIVFEPGLDYSQSPWHSLSRSMALKRQLYNDEQLANHPYILSMFLSFRSDTDHMSVEEWNEPSARMTFGCGGKPLKWSQLEIPYDDKVLRPLCVVAFTPRERAVQKAGEMLCDQLREKQALAAIQQRRKVLAIIGGTALSAGGLMAGYAYRNQPPANTIEMTDGRPSKLSLLGKTWEYDEEALPSTEGKIVPLMSYGYQNDDGQLTVSGFTSAGQPSFVFSNGKQSLVTAYKLNKETNHPEQARFYFDGNNSESDHYANEDTLVLPSDNLAGYEVLLMNVKLFNKLAMTNSMALRDIDFRKRRDLHPDKSQKGLLAHRNIGAGQLVSIVDVLKILQMPREQYDSQNQKTKDRLIVITEQMSLSEKEIQELLSAVRLGAAPGFLQHGHLLYTSAN